MSATQVPLLEIDEKVEGAPTFSVSDVVDAIGNGWCHTLITLAE